jgi:hypothetical protein
MFRLFHADFFDLRRDAAFFLIAGSQLQDAGTPDKRCSDNEKSALPGKEEPQSPLP